MAVQKMEKIQKFEASPDGEVLGVAMLALPTCIKASEILPLLERHGFANVDPNKWYSQQNIINLYKDIEEGRSNVTENLVAIGVKSVETMQFPPEVNTMKSMLMAMASSYDMVHRNTLPGEGTQVKFLTDNHVHIVINTPYPVDIFYGYYWGLMKKYVPKGMNFQLVPTNNPYTDMPGSAYDASWN